ncbi:hypothetical protein BDZ97DRAFT_2058287 [Flammula alnicola]|nr:hypothetical protein BDZ97DRAFT_2058287 [Flammula alnicola]
MGKVKEQVKEEESEEELQKRERTGVRSNPLRGRPRLWVIEGYGYEKQFLVQTYDDLVTNKLWVMARESGYVLLLIYRKTRVTRSDTRAVPYTPVTLGSASFFFIDGNTPVPKRRRPVKELAPGEHERLIQRCQEKEWQQADMTREQAISMAYKILLSLVSTEGLMYNSPNKGSAVEAVPKWVGTATIFPSVWVETTDLPAGSP